MRLLNRREKMNIFVTSSEPMECAQYLDDKRVVKMVLETAQMLSTAARECGYEGDDIYKSTHKNHPCNVWARETKQNYLWLLRHFQCLCAEYTHRYGKVHKSSLLYPSLLVLANMIPEGEMTPFANCAANDGLGISYKHIPCTFTAYRLYLADRWLHDKKKPTWHREAA